jgi:hypothetical protein
MRTNYTPAWRWTLASGMVGAALAEFRLQPTAASPLVGCRADADHGPVDLDETTIRALRILAAPAASLQQRHGGPLLAYGLSTACLGSGDAGVAVAAPRADDQFELLLYADARSFVDDWLDAHASAADEEVANLLPPPLPLAALPLLLHAIDAFRRASYQSALRHETDEPLSLSVAEFNRSLRDAAASADLRWLLPAFLQLTPGLDFTALAAGEGDPGLLAQFDLLTLRQPEPAPVFGFGTNGHLLGSEFIGGWHAAVGFELRRHGASVDATLARVFVAPTHLTNHWFEMAGDGLSVNHQALRVSVLAQRLDELLTSAAREPELAPTPAAGPRKCTHCGHTFSANARFCGGCGQPLDA